MQFLRVQKILLGGFVKKMTGDTFPDSGIDPEKKERFSRYLDQAEQGDTYAMMRVIDAYRVGIRHGVYRNFAGAEYWQKKRLETFLTRADEGDPAAMLSIALIYKFGEGVDPDPEQQKYWMQRRFKALLKKANENDSDSMYVLSMAYRYGQGTEKNQIQYQIWHEKYLSSQKKENVKNMFIGVTLPSELFELIQKFKKLKAYTDSEAVTFLCRYALENIEKYSFLSEKETKLPSTDLLMTKENLRQICKLYKLADSGHLTSMYLLWRISEEGLGGVEERNNEYREMYREETWRLFNQTTDPEQAGYEAFCDDALDKNL